MNALFLTQGAGLRMFYELALELERSLPLGRVGFLVSNSRHYEDFVAQRPEFESGRFEIAKEWEAARRARLGIPDLVKLRTYEKQIGDPNFWGALVADRRVTLGRRVVMRQDYKPRFSHGRMLRILEENLVEIDRLFETVKPDVVFSFLCVSVGEYLGYLFARARGVRFLNLRPTKVRDYVIYADSLLDPAPRLQAAYESYRCGGAEDEHLRRAREHIDAVRAGRARYEGVLPASRRPFRTPLQIARFGGGVVRLIREEYRYLHRFRDDYHVTDPLAGLVHRRLLNPLRAAHSHWRLRGDYVPVRELERREYVFVPLHPEPETTLHARNRHLLNQIEMVRSVAQNLLAGMCVVVKEHPAAIGKRAFGYYRKLREIPNVLLADPALEPGVLIDNAQLVATVASSVGLEALIRGKPVVTFGTAPFSLLPDSMVRKVTSENIGREVLVMLDSHTPDDESLARYLAATMRVSARLNLYTGLLGKRGRVRSASGTGSLDAERDREIGKLLRYTLDSVSEIEASHTPDAP